MLLLCLYFGDVFIRKEIFTTEFNLEQDKMLTLFHNLHLSSFFNITTAHSSYEEIDIICYEMDSSC